MLHLVFHYTLLLKHVWSSWYFSDISNKKKSEINNFLIKQFCSNLLHVVPHTWDEYALKMSDRNYAGAYTIASEFKYYKIISR